MATFILCMLMLILFKNSMFSCEFISVTYMSEICCDVLLRFKSPLLSPSNFIHIEFCIYNVY
jgi:hypothetical protein